MRLWQLILLASLAAMVSAAAFTSFLVLRPDRTQYPVQGIDVSHHQGTIDWNRVARAGVDFVYMKSSEGGDFRDRQFSRNWVLAKNAGIKRGAYHFFTLCRPGVDQAAHVIDIVPKDEHALPLAIDLEFSRGCKDKPPPEELRKQLRQFIEIVEKHYGIRVILYLYDDFDEMYEIARYFDRRLWRRSLYWSEPEGCWHIWQQHNWSRVHGIEGSVDWNALKPDNRGDCD